METFLEIIGCSDIEGGNVMTEGVLDLFVIRDLKVK